jgi:hypothetical protein
VLELADALLQILDGRERHHESIPLVLGHVLNARGGGGVAGVAGAHVDACDAKRREFNFFFWRPKKQKTKQKLIVFLTVSKELAEGEPTMAMSMLLSSSVAVAAEEKRSSLDGRARRITPSPSPPRPLPFWFVFVYWSWFVVVIRSQWASDGALRASEERASRTNSRGHARC